MSELRLVTGATGLVGGEIARQLTERGYPVRALVRGGSDTSYLESLGVECVAGDLSDAASLAAAVSGVHMVYHCGARVLDWGPWDKFLAEVVQLTTNLVTACEDSSVQRILHISSVAAFGHPRGKRKFTEDEPLEQHLWLWDYYPKAKAMCEYEVQKFSRAWTIIRPTLTYGPRDRRFLPRLLGALRRGVVRLIGRGDNLLSLVHVSDVAAGAILAAESEQAAGRSYNLVPDGEISQRDFINLVCDSAGLPPVNSGVPPRLAFGWCFFMEVVYKSLRKPVPPSVTRHSISVMSRSLQFTGERARAELGWQPQIDVRTGVRESVQSLIAAENGQPG